MRRETQIGRDTGGYRRGVVLGLTMAEIMLLLVFCLLISAGAAVQAANAALEKRGLAPAKAVADIERLQKTIDQMTAERRDLVERSELEKVRGKLRELERAAQRPKDWRRLEQADEIVALMLEAGLEPERVLENAELVAEVVDAAAEGTDSLVEAADKWRRLTIALDGSALGDAAPDEVAELAVLCRGAGKAHDWPPIISLSEAGGYSFAVGSAELTGPFLAALRGDVAARVASIVQEYGVDVVEVIGHTDEQPISARSSNLDEGVLDALTGRRSVETLVPADNAGLGLARAVSVARVLRSDSRLSKVRVLPLSAGQLVKPVDRITDGGGGDAQERRRIEIRVRRSADQQEGAK